MLLAKSRSSVSQGHLKTWPNIIDFKCEHILVFVKSEIFLITRIYNMFLNEFYLKAL